MKPTQTQLHLPIPAFGAESLEKTAKREISGRAANKLAPGDRAFHDWYRFVLSFPPHLVSSYVEDFHLDGRHLVLDPFCGTGTTLVESKLHGVETIGIEANIFAHFASSVKVDWEINPDLLKKEARKIADSTLGLLKAQGIDRLIDIFTSLTCYSLQNHLRTTVPNMGQVETDEIYIGIDKRGAHYVIRVQAKAGTDKIGIVQIEQDLAVCESKFPGLICRSIAAQFMEEDIIALFECEKTEDGIRVSVEKHYRLVDPEELTEEELEVYRKRPSD